MKSLLIRIVIKTCVCVYPIRSRKILMVKTFLPDVNFSRSSGCEQMNVSCPQRTLVFFFWGGEDLCFGDFQIFMGKFCIILQEVLTYNRLLIYFQSYKGPAQKILPPSSKIPMAAPVAVKWPLFWSSATCLHLWSFAVFHGHMATIYNIFAKCWHLILVIGKTSH